MDHEKFNKIAGGVQSIVVSVAAMLGGGWALYQFHTLQQSEKARLDIEELRSKQPVLNIDLSPSIMHVPRVRTNLGLQSERTYLRVVATIQNVGQANTYLDMSDEPLEVSHIVDPLGTVKAQEVEVSELNDVGDLVLCRAGSTTRFDFVAQIKYPGLYEISLGIPVETSEIQRRIHDPALVEYAKEMREAYDNLRPDLRSVLPPPTLDSASGVWEQKLYYFVPTIR